ncbi:hypothetical protein HMPREF1324_0918 [Rothia aeria F0474]|uniref:Uncharacterized protein n=1 Tax=Rothia aeria F0474 TaxID=1125724 RepID=I0UVX1_9MICC|nr:hypothetical protein HMPREF1324_0918 [Rothia aeria F0474]
MLKEKAISSWFREPLSSYYQVFSVVRGLFYGCGINTNEISANNTLDQQLLSYLEG